MPDADDAPVMLSLLLWSDARTSQEREMGGTQKWKACNGLIDAFTIVTIGEDESSDTPGAVITTCDGTEYRTAATYDALRAAFVAATGARIVEVG